MFRPLHTRFHAQESVRSVRRFTVEVVDITPRIRSIVITVAHVRRTTNGDRASLRVINHVVEHVPSTRTSPATKAGLS
jgi:predicted ATP-dependent serine protease